MLKNCFCQSHNHNLSVESSVVVIPFFSELELYLLRKEPELELAELDQLLELAPPLESVPLLELAPGIQCLGQSN